MIGIVIPVHDEEALLGGCLLSIIAAIDLYVTTTGIAAEAFIVLDACSDRSKSIAQTFDLTIIECAARSVGAARAFGAESAIAAGATWLAFTDADTLVAVDWLTCQRALGADAVCGTIGVTWTSDLDRARQDFELNYQDVDDHRHIHGANFGISACAYRSVGGFSDRRCHEDVAIVKKLIEAGLSIAWSARPRVMTSARQVGRAPAGFATALREQATAAATSDELLRVEFTRAERLLLSFSQLDVDAAALI